VTYFNNFNILCGAASSGVLSAFLDVEKGLSFRVLHGVRECIIQVYYHNNDDDFDDPVSLFRLQRDNHEIHDGCI
jgi:hypothetical protein